MVGLRETVATGLWQFVHLVVWLYRPVGRGVHGVRTHPRKNQKGPPDGIVKYLKWYKTNVVVVGLTIWMHFQQFEDLKFLIFDLPKTLGSVQLSLITRERPDSSWESRIRLDPSRGHGECPDFEDQLSQANKYIFLNYHIKYLS